VKLASGVDRQAKLPAVVLDLCAGGEQGLDAVRLQRPGRSPRRAGFCSYRQRMPDPSTISAGPSPATQQVRPSAEVRNRQPRWWLHQARLVPGAEVAARLDNVDALARGGT
jgi:hypothetical protein